jgi:hypothetical protein
MKNVFIFVLSNLCSSNGLLTSPPLISGIKGADFILPEQLPILLDVRIETGIADRNCQGFGLCTIALDLNWKITDKLVANQGHGTASLANGHLEISILKRSVDARTTNSFFSENTFQMGADLKIPTMLAKELGIDSYTIKAGQYSIHRTDEAYNLSF